MFRICKLYTPLTIFLLLFILVSCENSISSTAIETASDSANVIDSEINTVISTEADIPSDMPSYSIADIISRITTPIAPKYFDLPEGKRPNYIQESDENERIYSSSGSINPPADGNSSYHFTSWFQAGDNGVELMDNLYRWTDAKKQKIREQEEMGMLPSGGPNPLQEWMSDFISYPEDSFDITEYKKKALEAVKKIYDTQFSGEAPADLKLNQASRIQASFEYEDEQTNLDCKVLEFDVEQTDSAYQKIYYFVDTDAEEDKTLWMFIRCLKMDA